MASCPMWEEARSWLISAGVPIKPTGTLVDFVSALQNGALLCDLLNRLVPDSVAEIHRKGNNVQFLSLKNINAFLTACQRTFGLRQADLFLPEDLYHATHFDCVILALSRLSQTMRCHDAGLKPFPSTHSRVVDDHDVYGNLETLVEARTGDAIRNMRRLKGFSLNVNNPDAPHASDGAGDYEYEEIQRMASDDIYDELCHVRDIKSKQLPRADRRSLIVEELKETERSYLAALTVIAEKFQVPLQSNIDRLGGSALDVQLIFQNIDDLIACHQHVLSLAATARPIAEVLVECRDRFLAYARFCGYLTIALETLEDLSRKREFAGYLRLLGQRSGQRFELKDLLCVPMQRLVKYHLLLQDLLKHTPEGHPERPAIAAALTNALDLAKHVNECKRDVDNSLLVERQIQASLRDFQPFQMGAVPLTDCGRFVCDTDVQLRLDSVAKISRRYIFLFQKAIVVCKTKLGNCHFLYIMILRDFLLEDEPDKGKTYGFTLRSSLPAASGLNCTLFFSSPALKKQWLDAVLMCKSSCVADGLRKPAPGIKAHHLVVTCFKDSQSCSFCNRLLWGYILQGFECSHCKVRAHHDCVQRLDPRCIISTGPRAKDGSYYEINDHRTTTIDPRTRLPTAAASDHAAAAAAGPRGSRDGPYFHALTMAAQSAGSSHLRAYEDSSPLAQSGDVKKHTYVNLQIGSDSSEEEEAGYEVVKDVPPPSANKWFVGPMDRDASAALLDLHRDGAFVVRESTTRPGEYALAVVHTGAVKHLKIDGGPGSYFLGKTRTFPSVQELVTHYGRNSLAHHFPSITCMLVHPMGSRELSERGAGAVAGTTVVAAAAAAGSGRAVAMYDFSSTNKDEISFKVGDEIRVQQREGFGAGWWRGTHVPTGRAGLFPAAYVRE
eukprot:m.151957 g.151957  ORF g.151957 m.151957 type:complete len:894 (+) comp15100_c2_seq4:180-2861(+)